MNEYYIATTVTTENLIILIFTFFKCYSTIVWKNSMLKDLCRWCDTTKIEGTKYF